MEARKAAAKGEEGNPQVSWRLNEYKKYFPGKRVPLNPVLL